MKRFIGMLIACAVAGAAVEGWADNASETEALAKLFDPGTKNLGQLFTSEFLAQVPEPKLREIVDYYAGMLGAYRKATGGSGSYQLSFDKGEAPSKVSLDSVGRIQGLWFGLPALYDDTPEKLAAAFKALDGKVSACVIKDGTATVFVLDPDAPLAVGSTFKLYILKALSQRIGAGSMKWEDVVRIKPEWASLPTGILQAWPAGTPVTLATLAALMISVSDNTAADHLLYTLGRNAVEAAAPQRLRPFLSTREMFTIKWGMSDKDRAAYLAAPADKKAGILSGLGPVDPGMKIPMDEPFLIDSVEWPVTARELCQVIYDLRDVPALSINAGLVEKASWSLAGFKGGSEPGVLNYTHVLRKTATSPVYSVSVTINDASKAVDTEGFTILVSRLIGMIGKGKL